MINFSLTFACCQCTVYINVKHTCVASAGPTVTVLVEGM